MNNEIGVQRINSVSCLRLPVSVPLSEGNRKGLPLRRSPVSCFISYFLIASILKAKHCIIFYTNLKS